MDQQSNINKESTKVWNQIAELYQDKFMDITIYNQSYNLFLQFLPLHTDVLEIACGPGNITRFLYTQRTDLTILAVDTSSEMIKLAKANIPEAELKVMDCREINQLESLFGGIICGFCIPYLNKNEVSQFVEDCSSKLTLGGVFYLSWIAGKYENSQYLTSSQGGQLFTHYYEEQFISQEMSKQGFSILEKIEIDYPDKINQKQKHLIIIAKKVH